MPLGAIAALVAGLAVLTAGAEFLVRGASRIAEALGISSLVVGLTVVAYGTSTPELAVSVRAALEGNAAIAVGNVVGSNVFNVLLILGACATLSPLVVARRMVRLDVPIMVAASLAVWALALDGRIGRWDGVSLAAAAVALTIWTIRGARGEAPATGGRPVTGSRARWRSATDVAWVLAGLGLLIVGSRWLVAGAVAIARAAGVSDVVVGLTIVAAGTSLPEVATSVVATLRGERDIAVGNVVGSNLYNLLAILGLSAAVGPAGLPVAPSILRFDFPVMIAAAIACLPVFFSGHRIARGEGALFLFLYLAYALYLVLDATGHDALRPFSAAMAWFVLPLVAATLAVVGARALLERWAKR